MPEIRWLRSDDRLRTQRAKYNRIIKKQIARYKKVSQRTRYPAHLLMNVCSQLRRVRRPFRRVGRTVASWSWSSSVVRRKSTLVRLVDAPPTSLQPITPHLHGFRVFFRSTAALESPPPRASVRRGSSVERTRLRSPRISRGRRALVVCANVLLF